MSICVCAFVRESERVKHKQRSTSAVGHTVDGPLLSPSSWRCSPHALGCFSPSGTRLMTAPWMAALVLGSLGEEGASAGTAGAGEGAEDMQAAEGVVSRPRCSWSPLNPSRGLACPCMPACR